VEARGEEIDHALSQLEELDLKNRLAVISPGAVRVHKKHAS
jgi:hypothetical protein